MLTAQQKFEENIAEYILYMYQIEDVIRAYKFDLERIMTEFVTPQIADDETLIAQYRKWYKGLILNMQDQHINNTGHLLELNETLVELSYLHSMLLGQANDSKYLTIVENAKPLIEEFKQKSNLKDKNDIELLLNAMYMKLLLRLQKKEILPETEKAFEAMRIMLAYLAQTYHKMKRGDLDFLNN